jgi:hypothetical protein
MVVEVIERRWWLIGPAALLSPLLPLRVAMVAATFSFVLISLPPQFNVSMRAQVIPFPTPPTLAPSRFLQIHTRALKCNPKQWKSKAVGHLRPHFEGMNAYLTLYIETVQIVSKDNRILGRTRRGSILTVSAFDLLSRHYDQSGRISNRIRLRI